METAALLRCLIAPGVPQTGEDPAYLHRVSPGCMGVNNRIGGERLPEVCLA